MAANEKTEIDLKQAFTVDFLRQIRSFVLTEKGMSSIELDNKVTFLGEKSITKADVKFYFDECCGKKVRRVNILNDVSGLKKVMVSFVEEGAASAFASDLGLM